MAGWIPEPERWSYVIEIGDLDALLGPAVEVERFEREWRIWLATPHGRFEQYYAARTRP